MSDESLLRRPTKVIKLGNVMIGGNYPISIQSMTNTPTADIAATVRQIQALADVGCEIARVAVPDLASAEALVKIKKAVNIPLVADIHFDYLLALKAIEAGVDGLRINPGNIGSQEKVALVAHAAQEQGIPIRIGVNGGSLEKKLLNQYGGVTAEAMAESALGHIAYLEKVGFRDIKISVKSSSIPVMVKAYELLAAKVEYPFHIGLTEAGTKWRGTIKSAAGIGILLAKGFGDTVRVSLTGDPVEEVLVAKEILAALGLRDKGFEFISCPTCGRTKIDVEGIALQVERELSAVVPAKKMKIAIMGCAVNGPGEAGDADVGICGGSGEGLLLCHGEVIGRYPMEKLADVLVAQVKSMIGGNI